MSTEIELGNNIVIPCPEKGFDLRLVKHCLVCPHYQGLAQATERGEAIEGDAADDYLIICGRPITRRMKKIEVD